MTLSCATQQAKPKQYKILKEKFQIQNNIQKDSCFSTLSSDLLYVHYPSKKNVRQQPFDNISSKECHDQKQTKETNCEGKLLYILNSEVMKLNEISSDLPDLLVRQLWYTS